MNDSVQRRLPFLDRVRPNGVPRLHRYYEGAKTSCAEYEVAYGFASPLQSLSPSSLPCGRDFRLGPARLSPVADGILDWSNTGPPRFLGSPSRTFALLSDPGRSGWPHLDGPLSSIPTYLKNRDTSNRIVSRLYHTASVHPAYASSNALPHSHARLGSGCWLGFTGRDSNPLNSNKWFPPTSASPTTRFILALSNLNYHYNFSENCPLLPP